MLAVTPLDLETLGRNGQLCAEGAAALGASGGPISRNAGRCVQCSSCPLGCQIDAKRATHVSYLPRAVAAGARVRAGVRVAANPHGERAGDGPRLPGRAADHGCAGNVSQWAPASGTRLAGARESRDQRRRRLRHPGAAEALRHQPPRPRPAPAHPPRRLDRRPLRGGGPRLGRRHAELLRRSVAAGGDPARGDLHPALLRRAVAAGCRRRLLGPSRQLRPHRLDRRPPARPLGGAGRPHLERARCGSPTACSRRRPGRSSSGSRAQRRCTSPPARPRSIPTSARSR